MHGNGSGSQDVRRRCLSPAQHPIRCQLNPSQELRQHNRRDHLLEASGDISLLMLVMEWESQTFVRLPAEALADLPRGSGKKPPRRLRTIIDA
uniref:Uncharacterized protein n=1 Tax=Sphaerodactylus townsendi TaxID=933632 RepID=A0ACB8EAL5_9SAUR